MSDGNFNRSLLPHTPYQSGLRMGKALMRGFAVRAFREYVKETSPTLSEEEVTLRTERFGTLLSLHSV